MRNLRLFGIMFGFVNAFIHIFALIACEPFEFDMNRCFADDLCAQDPDRDGLATIEDNCPLVFNPDQIDTDYDGVGDRCESEVPTDTKDNDGEGSTDDPEVTDNDTEPTDGDVSDEDVHVAEEVAEPDIPDPPPDEGPEVKETDTEDTSDADAEFEDADGADIPPPIDVEEDLAEPEDTQDEVKAEVEAEVQETTDAETTEDTDVPPIDLCEGVNCNDNNPCTDDSCDPETGKCEVLDNNTPCNDGNPCTQGDICADAACVSGTNECDCETNGDCVEKNDADLCNGTLVCVSNECVVDPATIIICSQSSEPCFEARCEPATGVCGDQPLGGESCDDDDLCTIDDVCSQAGECEGNLLPCDDSNICTTDSCDPLTGCQFSNNLLPCEDGNLCTLLDNCLASTCLPGSLRNCDDGNLCTGSETCNPETGDCVADPAPPLNCCLTNPDCFDSSECTTDTCHKEDGTCENADIDCDDQDACTSDSCDPDLGCINADIVCEDDDECTADKCVAEDGTCENADIDCSDNNVCTADSCDPLQGCAHENVVCEDDNPCTADSCVQGIGCSFQELTEIPCTDDNACTLEDHCLTGACVYESLLSCGDDNVCTDDICDPNQGCMLLPNSSPCSDGLACTVEDKCADSLCVSGNPVDCNDNNPCTLDACDPTTGACVHPPKICNDGHACTADSCNPLTGACTHKRNDGVCNDLNKCTYDVCDPGSGCHNLIIKAGVPGPGGMCDTIDYDGDGVQDDAIDLDSDGKNCASKYCGDGFCDNASDKEEAMLNPSYLEGQTCNFNAPVDNCPPRYNPGQEDQDGDGIGDPCDPTP